MPKTSSTSARCCIVFIAIFLVTMSEAMDGYRYLGLNFLNNPSLFVAKQPSTNRPQGEVQVRRLNAHQGAHNNKTPRFRLANRSPLRTGILIDERPQVMHFDSFYSSVRKGKSGKNE